jgi:uncharacterized OB-fold protein
VAKRGDCAVSLDEELSSKGLKDEKAQSWIPVQPGLFEYPVPDGQVPALLANRCTKCGKSFFPKRTLCPYCCDKGIMEDITLDRQGIIYASTVIYIPSPVGIKAPYAYGYVEIPANQVRIFALFTGDDPFSFTPGQEVELVLEPIRKDHQGKQIIGYKFKLVE